MLFRLGLAALAVVAVPMVVAAQQPARTPAKSERRICRSDVDIGSRVARVRRCYSKAEYAAMKQESREVVDRVQALKVMNNGESVPGRPGLSNGSLPQ
ncbi:MAG TPA: hypothetical protein VEX35_07865 [Allosphingosinicella sp.]|nr:hypothetical protein [Allosphingosinicella sp.]